MRLCMCSRSPGLFIPFCSFCHSCMGLLCSVVVPLRPVRYTPLGPAVDLLFHLLVVGRSRKVIDSNYSAKAFIHLSAVDLWQLKHD